MTQCRVGLILYRVHYHNVDGHGFQQLLRLVLVTWCITKIYAVSCLFILTTRSSLLVSSSAQILIFLSFLIHTSLKVKKKFEHGIPQGARLVPITSNDCCTRSMINEPIEPLASAGVACLEDSSTGGIHINIRTDHQSVIGRKMILVSSRLGLSSFQQI